MQISNNFIAVEKLEEPKTEGFQTVEVQDSSTFKGKVKFIPEAPVHIGNDRVMVGSIVIFAKYSPNTHDVEVDSMKLKAVSITDLIFLL